jgi:hypothetical protein
MAAAKQLGLGNLTPHRLPEWFRQLRAQAGKTVYPDLVFDPKSPGFSVFRQTEETERIKALGIALLTEHELDRHGAAQNGAFTITCLMTRTVFDYELYAFYARFLADAKRPTQAMEAARMSLYLNPEPRGGHLSCKGEGLHPLQGTDGLLLLAWTHGGAQHPLPTFW